MEHDDHVPTAPRGARQARRSVVWAQPRTEGGTTRRAIATLLTLPLLAGLALQPPAGAQDPPVQVYGARDRSVTALNILPPGQGRYLNGPEQLIAAGGGPQPPHNTDQVGLYDHLIDGAPDIEASELLEYFKDATFGVKDDDVEREYSPREGVTVVRDAGFGVPHVYGDTREDMMFGAGYVTGEDRLFMIDTLRHVGRGRLSEFLGASEANLAMDRAWYLSAGYTEEEFQSMLDRGPELHPVLGPQAVADVMAYADGINAFIAEARLDPSKMPAEYEALQLQLEDWVPTDTVAVASVIGSALGVGGGSELDNAEFVGALMAKGLSFKTARRILADFRFANDPEAPVHTTRAFPFNTGPKTLDARSRAFPDAPGEMARQMRKARGPDHIDGPWGPMPWSFPSGMSNALLVGEDLSKSGRPLAVMGPQTAYWSPEILMEIDMHAPGFDSRGVGFPGISLYTLLGRGSDYAWSATSAGGDQVDVFAEKLCDPEGGEVSVDSLFYRHRGECIEMYSRTDTWAAKPSAGGAPEGGTVMVEMTTQRTDDGIVQARGTVDGDPVAFVAKRASFMKEVDSALAYVELADRSKINSAKDFRKAFARFNFTFNWFYLDGRDIAFQMGGNHPIRSSRVDPDLPVWGTKSKWDWQGRLSFKDTPFLVSPGKGYITSWNNKQAPRFTANDGQYSYGPVHRVDPLDLGIKALKKKGKLTLTDVVNVMGDAATVDLRGLRVAPWMTRALGRLEDERLATAKQILKDWTRSGAHRRDKDGDGAYDDSAAVALMDAWWPLAVEAIFRPTLGDAFDVLPFGIDDIPRAQGSAYQNGLYGHVQKDLRNVLGKKVRGRFSRVYCGEGSLSACREALRASLDAAVSALEESFGADPATWDADEDADMIQYTPLGVQGQDPMRWQNRPTFQQVVEFRP